jgi:adenylylsulfate kinase
VYTVAVFYDGIDMTDKPEHLSRIQREQLMGHRGLILWYTGLSGSGKSTLANAVAAELHRQGVHTFVLDGDNVRARLNADLGFSREDRDENVRRVQELARLFMEAGIVVGVAVISPYRADRERLRLLVGQEDYVEIYCSASLESCEARDVKGLYKAAREGAVKDFTGVSAPYEPPANPDAIVDTGALPLEKCVRMILAEIARRDIGRPILPPRMRRND